MLVKTDSSAVGTDTTPTADPYTTTVFAANFGAPGQDAYPTSGAIEYDSANGYGFVTGSPGYTYRQSFSRNAETDPILDSVTRCESYWDTANSVWAALPSTYKVTLTAGNQYRVTCQFGDSATAKNQVMTCNSVSIINETAGGSTGHVTKTADVTADSSGDLIFSFGTAGTDVTALNSMLIVAASASDQGVVTGGGGGADNTNPDNNTGGNTQTGGTVPLLGSAYRGIYAYGGYNGRGANGSQDAAQGDPWETPKENGIIPITLPSVYRPFLGTMDFQHCAEGWSRSPSVEYSAARGWTGNTNKNTAAWHVHISLRDPVGLDDIAASPMESSAKSWFQQYFSLMAAAQAEYPNNPRPVVRLMSEANGQWSGKYGRSYWHGSTTGLYPGDSNSTAGAANYVAGWQAIHALAAAEGATPLWMWSPMAWVSGGSGSILDPTSTYPGSSYVDIIAIDWYTEEKRFNGPVAVTPLPIDDTTQTLSLTSCLDRAHQVDTTKPLAIGECGMQRNLDSDWQTDIGKFFQVCADWNVSQVCWYYDYDWTLSDYRIQPQLRTTEWNAGVSNWLNSIG